MPRGPRAPKSRAQMVTPRYYDFDKYKPMERPSSGQGPGETRTPESATRYVRGIMQRKKLPRGR